MNTIATIQTANKRRTQTTSQAQAFEAKRNYLRELSAPLKELVQSGDILNVNEGLKQIYHAKGHKGVKTIQEWAKLGYSIKRGEKALLLWGKPRKSMFNTNKNIYPISHVYSFAQVEKAN